MQLSIFSKVSKVCRNVNSVDHCRVSDYFSFSQIRLRVILSSKKPTGREFEVIVVQLEKRRLVVSNYVS